MEFVTGNTSQSCLDCSSQARAIFRHKLFVRATNIDSSVARRPDPVAAAAIFQ